MFSSGSISEREVEPRVRGLWHLKFLAWQLEMSTSALVLIVYSEVGTVPGLGSGF